MNFVTRFRLFWSSIVKSMRPRNVKITVKLAFTYMAAITVCMLILNGFYYFRTRDYINQRTLELLSNTNKQVKNNLQYKIDRYNSFSNAIYRNNNLQDLLYADYTNAFDKMIAQDKIDRYFQDMKESYKEIIKLQVFAFNRSVPGYGEFVTNTGNAEEQDWYGSINHNEDDNYWYYSNINPKNTSLSVIKMMRHFRSGSEIGVLKIDLNINSLFSDLREAGKGSSGWIDLVDREGKLIYSDSGTEWMHDKVEVRDLYAKDIPLGKSTDVQILDTEDGKFVVLNNYLDSTKWNIIYVTPLKQVQTDINNFQVATIAVIILSTVVFIGLSWFMASKSTKKVRLLSSSMKKIQEGNFDVHIQHAGSDEIDDLIHGFNTMAGRLKVLIDQVYTVKIEEKELELKALQAQINPHFLYNTLATVSWLGMRVKSEDITNISDSLARFYKISLNKGKDLLKVRTELEQIQAYLEIQCIRFRNRIHMVYEISEEVLESDTVRLIIQPFLENAIVHGMTAKKRTITIRVVVERIADTVVWKVIDDGVGITSERLKKILSGNINANGGYGILNVDKRIKLCFGEKYGIHIFSKPGIGTVVTIITPMSTDSIPLNDPQEMQV